MKALTVLQPWAWAIIHGPKRIENRTWRTNYRGPLAIHAGLSRRMLCVTLNNGMIVPEDALVFGALLGVVDLVDCVSLADAPPDPFAEGPYCWLLENPPATVTAFLDSQAVECSPNRAASSGRAGPMYRNPAV